MSDQNNGVVWTFVKANILKITGIILAAGIVWASLQLAVSGNSEEIYRNYLDISEIKDDIQDFKIVDAKILEQLKYITQMIKDIKETHK